MSNIKYTSNLSGEGGWLTGIELDPVAVDAAPGSDGWKPVSAVIDADENGDIEVEYTKSGAVEVTVDIYSASARENPTYTKVKTITGYPGTIALIHGDVSSMWLCDTTGVNDNKAIWPFTNRNGKAAIPDIAAINEAGDGTNPYTYNGIAYMETGDH